MRSIHRATAFGGAVLLVVLAGCAGRSSQWSAEEEDTKTPPMSPRAEAELAERIAEGDAAWEQRLERPQVEKAIAAWSSAAQRLEPPNIDLLVKLTRAHYFLADAFLREEREPYLRTLDTGVEWGEAAILAASPEFASSMREGAKFRDAIRLAEKPSVPAMFWYASVLGRWAQEKGLAVVLGQQDSVKATMDRCLELEPTYFHGGPHRYFGVYYAVAPEFTGGDLEKSKIHFKKALELAPLYAGTKVLWASEFAVRAKDRDLFERLLTEVQAMPVDAIPELRPETEIEQRKASEWLARSEELF